jgi:hypothetical protein
MFRLLTISLAAAGTLLTGASRPEVTPGGRGFPSAEAAVQALVSAAVAGDVSTVIDILGPVAKDFIPAGAAAERKICRDFAAQAIEKMKLVTCGGQWNETVLLTGHHEWPLPFVIVKIQDKWYFKPGQSRRQPQIKSVWREADPLCGYR